MFEDLGVTADEVTRVVDAVKRYNDIEVVVLDENNYGHVKALNILAENEKVLAEFEMRLVITKAYSILSAMEYVPVIPLDEALLIDLAVDIIDTRTSYKDGVYVRYDYR